MLSHLLLEERESDKIGWTVTFKCFEDRTQGYPGEPGKGSQYLKRRRSEHTAELN